MSMSWSRERSILRGLGEKIVSGSKNYLSQDEIHRNMQSLKIGRSFAKKVVHYKLQIRVNAVEEEQLQRRSKTIVAQRSRNLRNYEEITPRPITPTFGYTKAPTQVRGFATPGRDVPLGDVSLGGVSWEGGLGHVHTIRVVRPLREVVRLDVSGEGLYGLVSPRESGLVVLHSMWGG